MKHDLFRIKIKKKANKSLYQRMYYRNELFFLFLFHSWGNRYIIKITTPMMSSNRKNIVARTRKIAAGSY